jgi:hypothetical protein
MQQLLVLPALVFMVACGSSRLSRQEAERDIRKDYPVVACVHVKSQENAVKGSAAHARLVTLQEELTKTGWFQVARKTEGDHETFTFSVKPNAPKSIRTAPQGFEMEAAKVDFMHVLRIEPSRDGAQVTYQIRLTKPLEHFALLQKLNPEVRIGATRNRHATYVKEGRKWILNATDEKDRKAD